MKYLNEISDTVDIINIYLNNIRIPSLWQNHFLMIDELSNEAYLKFCTKKTSDNTIPLEIIFDSTELTINVGDITEVFCFKLDFIKNNRVVLEEILSCIFESYIFMGYSRFYLTRMIFFNTCGMEVKRISLFRYFHLNYKKNQLYHPIYNISTF